MSGQRRKVKHEYDGGGKVCIRHGKIVIGMVQFTFNRKAGETGSGAYPVCVDCKLPKYQPPASENAL